VLFNLGRNDVTPPAMRLVCQGGLCDLRLSAAWLEANPLTQAALAEELSEWRALAPVFRLVSISATG
jgi:hypothetical protein